MGGTIRRTGGVFVLPAYGQRFPESYKGNEPYLGCRVGRYVTPYANEMELGSCGRGLGHTLRFLHNNSAGSVGGLARRVRATTRGLRFRETTSVESVVGSIHGVDSGRGIITAGVSSNSIVTNFSSSNGAYCRIFHFRNKELFSHRDFIFSDNRDRSRARRFLLQCCALHSDIPGDVTVSERFSNVRRVTR